MNANFNSILFHRNKDLPASRIIIFLNIIPCGVPGVINIGLGPPGWGLGVGSTTPHRKKLPVRKPEFDEKDELEGAVKG